MVVYDLQAYSSLPRGSCDRMMTMQNVDPNGQVCMAANALPSQLRMAVLPVVAKEAPRGQAAQFTSVARLVCDLQAYSSQPRGSCDRMMTMQNVDPNGQVCIPANVLPSQLRMAVLPVVAKEAPRRPAHEFQARRWWCVTCRHFPADHKATWVE